MKKLSTLQKWRISLLSPHFQTRSFRSDAALEAIAGATLDGVPAIALYNYPSFSGAFSALFTRLFHERVGIPCLVLPFSSFVPLRVEDFFAQSFERLYLLDFVGPRGFAEGISRRSSCEVIAFDHRKSVLDNWPPEEVRPEKLKVHMNVEKSSSVAVYEYFSAKLAEIEHSDASLLELKDRDRVEMVLKYIEDADLCRQILPDTKAFHIALEKWRSKLNCLTNPYMYEQLLEISAVDLIDQGNSYISAREKAAEKFLDNAFKVRLGDGFYGECLAVRADENPDLTNEIGKKLSVRSVAAGLRPIGAVIYVKRRNLKMCLRSTDSLTDTSEIAKAYGGGGCPSSSAFVLRREQYNQWRCKDV